MVKVREKINNIPCKIAANLLLNYQQRARFKSSLLHNYSLFTTYGHTQKSI
ncbi:MULTISPECIES: hypothetical protein [unclassified Candidatus Cardinium]|uniref:hypothetical protein n=1 Tax=unclassified Candidatus Cardinium TaxID=2641185 RepID=UPI001FB1A920|nr:MULTISPECIES: hypothetical protein [unclassified Candidatus Cardinium]